MGVPSKPECRDTVPPAVEVRKAGPRLPNVVRGELWQKYAALGADTGAYCPVRPAALHARTDTGYDTGYKEQKPPDYPGVPYQVSNRDHDQSHRVVYVNGVRTAPQEAEQAAARMQRTLGAVKLDCVYNPPEQAVSGFAKVAGSVVSPRLTARQEPECVGTLCTHIDATLADPKAQLTVVAHSHGSAVVAAALTRVYDRLQTAQRGDYWDQNSGRIKVICLAPTVAAMVPGPQTFGVVDSADPVRSVAGVAGGVSWLKDVAGYRRSAPIAMVRWKPEGRLFSDLVFDPTHHHEALGVMLGSRELFRTMMGRGQHQEDFSAGRFAANLIKSIREGALSDLMHCDLIVCGCEKDGRAFAEPFLNALTLPAERGSTEYSVDNFIVPKEILLRLRRVVDPGISP